ncbi:uncharacterized protein LOC113069639 [Carassius auratus]|uniref:Uncharacterized protein LOC113069639 n=1 Tax=Carassius auratus TaxID=7957 RepID=A0A6P6MQ90_CARAU|nr:uncharacterized protein LOC113069639 [Carassius auratus]
MDDDTLDCAKGFVRKLEDFEFVFMLYTYEQICSETNVVFDIVQQRAMDVLYCKNRIESLLAFVKEKRSEGAFQAIYAKTADLTSDPRDEPMRKRRLTQLQDPQVRYRKLCDYLVFLKDMELDSAMPQLYKLFSLVATIGATSAGVERSFSCLKRLKSYTRNTMGQGRLSSLALLAIERTLVKSLEKTPSWYDSKDSIMLRSSGVGLRVRSPASVEERRARFQNLATLRQKESEVGGLAQMFWTMAVGMGYNDLALKDLFIACLDNPVPEWEMNELEILAFWGFIGLNGIPQPHLSLPV